MTPEEAAVFAPVADLFRGLATKDAALMRAAIIPEGSATNYRNGKFLKASLPGLIDRLMAHISQPGRFEEVMEAPVIHIDHNIAVVWGAFTTFKDGVPQTCGTNLISLIHEDGRWRVASITDTSRPYSPS